MDCVGTHWLRVICRCSEIWFGCADCYQFRCHSTLDGEWAREAKIGGSAPLNAPPSWLAVLAEMARAETDTLRERINSGLAEARRKGVKLGRPKGSTLEQGELLAKHKDVVKMLRDGHSIRHAAKIAGKGISTVQRVKAALDAAA